MAKQTKSITFYNDDFCPEVGDELYLTRYDTLYTSNTFSGNKRGDTYSSYHLSRTPSRTNMSNEEREDGWLGSYLGGNYQKDGYALGIWRVVSINDKKLSKMDKDNFNYKKFSVRLEKNDR